MRVDDSVFLLDVELVFLRENMSLTDLAGVFLGVVGYHILGVRVLHKTIRASVPSAHRLCARGH